MMALCAAVVLASCKDATLPGELGAMQGTWDGAAWSGAVTAVLQNGTLWLSTSTPDPDQHNERHLDVNVPFTGPGTYTVARPQLEVGYLVGGDQLFDPPATGTLVITRYDAATHQLAGTVEADGHAAGISPQHVSVEFHTPVYGSFSAVPKAR